MTKALEDLKVVDLSRVLAGPWATQILADLGADVIKIEHPGAGDDTRTWGPPFLSCPTTGKQGDSAYFTAANRNKQSLAVDFSMPQGQELIRNLARQADILVENFRPGTLARYGLDYDRLSADNPRLIYCSITAFGQSGSLKHRPGYDFAMQGMGGLMSITGQPDGSPGAEPMKVGVAVTDLLTGMYAATGILAAVHARTLTGRGQHIDLALFEVQVAMLANQAANYLVGDVVPQRMGNAHPNVAAYQVFPSSDGHLILAIGNDAQFRRACAALGRADLAADPAFATNASRLLNRAAIVAELTATFRQRTTAEWLDVLEKGDVPSAPINRLDQVFSLPQIVERDVTVKLAHPTGPLTVVANPIRLSETPAAYDRPPPLLGEHSDMVLSQQLGLDRSKIAELRAAGVIK